MSGGGGAAVAVLGAARAFEEAGLEPELICGCSGGGLFSSGSRPAPRTRVPHQAQRQPPHHPQTLPPPPASPLSPRPEVYGMAGRHRSRAAGFGRSAAAGAGHAARAAIKVHRVAQPLSGHVEALKPMLDVVDVGVRTHRCKVADQRAPAITANPSSMCGGIRRLINRGSADAEMPGSVGRPVSKAVDGTAFRRGPWIGANPGPEYGEIPGGFGPDKIGGAERNQCTPSSITPGQSHSPTAVGPARPPRTRLSRSRSP
ncbi:MAG: hypothetical protein ACLP0L_23455 [Solirubrobacteraceae bacterium]